MESKRVVRVASVFSPLCASHLSFHPAPIHLLRTLSCLTPLIIDALPLAARATSARRSSLHLRPLLSIART
jgi:hypothetical protein